MEMYTSEDISKMCNCSKTKAYNIIRGLNSILLKNGVSRDSIISGKVSKKWFHETLKI